MKRKKEFLIILISIFVIILSVSVAYFTTKIISNNRKVTVTSKELKIVFTNGSGEINGDIEPGWSSDENTFTVKNETNNDYTYDIVIKDLVNTTVTNGFLVYKITSTDGGYNMTNFVDVPKSSTATDTILAEKIVILKGETHTYNVVFKYIEDLYVNQDEDQGKEFTGTIFIANIGEKESSATTLAEQLLNDNPTRLERTSFSSVLTTTNTGTLYTSTESIVGSTPETVYYFAGDAQNNWVKFGNFYWRIIRTNHDGSIRLLYVGAVTNNTDFSKNAYNYISAGKSKPRHSGYMYGNKDGLDYLRDNTQNSSVKARVDDWYKNNLTSYTNYLSNDAIYCNDRGAATYSDTSTFNFDSYVRLRTTLVPTYDCVNSKDAFSANNTDAKLTYPIGLMTADEVVFAGGRYNKSASTWYMKNSSGSVSSIPWWTMTPYNWSSTGNVREFYVTAVGTLSFGGVYTDNVNIRPVISIKSCTLWKSGNGSSNEPYEIVEDGGC